MEFKVTQVEKKEFEPIKVEFTIDSEEALKQLLNRLNTDNIGIDNSYSASNTDIEMYHDLWCKLDKYITI